MPDTVFPYDDEVINPYDDEVKNPHEESGEQAPADKETRPAKRTVKKASKK
jgi:hypothetical protein